MDRCFAKSLDRGDHPIYWDFNGNHAVRLGPWKLVAERSKQWELFNLARERSETIDLASSETARVESMAQQYDAWARRTGARLHAKCASLKASTQSQLFDLP